MEGSNSNKINGADGISSILTKKREGIIRRKDDSSVSSSTMKEIPLSSSFDLMADTNNNNNHNNNMNNNNHNNHNNYNSSSSNSNGSSAVMGNVHFASSDSSLSVTSITKISNSIGNHNNNNNNNNNNNKKKNKKKTMTQIHPLAVEEAFSDDEDEMMKDESPHPQHKSAKLKRSFQLSRQVPSAVTDSSSSSSSSSSSKKKMNKIWIHGSLLLVQSIFGLGSVVGSLGLPRFHPLTFALVRETSATVLLLVVAHMLSQHRGGLLSGSWKDLPRLMCSGLGVFGSQAFYIIGVKLAGAVPASVWQPAAPIVTASLCILLGWEPFRCIRVAGILFAFMGCAYMVIAGNTTTSIEEGGPTDTDTDTTSRFTKLSGHISFFFNTLGVSLYVMSSKSVLATDRYEPIAITAWSYVIATTCMAIVSGLFSLSPTISKFLCKDCDPQNIWHVPPTAISALIFYIIFTSALAYTLIMFANKHASSTLVTGYSVLQPVITDIFVVVLLQTGIYPSCPKEPTTTTTTTACLEGPDQHAVIGAIAVIAGLLVMITTEPSKQHKQQQHQQQKHQQQQEDEEIMSLLEMAETIDNPKPTVTNNSTTTTTKELQSTSTVTKPTNNHLEIKKSFSSSSSAKESICKSD